MISKILIILYEMITGNKNIYSDVQTFRTIDFSHYPTHLYKYRDCNEEYNFKQVFDPIIGAMCFELIG